MICRRVQLFESGADIQTRVLLLLDNHLRPLLYAGHRLLGLFLARPERHPRQGVARGHHPTHHVHSGVWHQRPAASSLLHQGHRRLDGSEYFCLSALKYIFFKITQCLIKCRLVLCFLGNFSFNFIWVFTTFVKLQSGCKIVVLFAVGKIKKVASIHYSSASTTIYLYDS